MPTLATIIVHPQGTQANGLRYQFTPKHHGMDLGAAQWLVTMTLDEEFGVFDGADQHALADGRGWLYGIWPDGTSGLRSLGTLDQQVAEFPHADPPEPWHGYPLYPLKGLGPDNRRGERLRPAKAVFDRMLTAGVITKTQRRKLMKGDYA